MFVTLNVSLNARKNESRININKTNINEFISSSFLFLLIPKLSSNLALNLFLFGEICFEKLNSQNTHKLLQTFCTKLSQIAPRKTFTPHLTSHPTNFPITCTKTLHINRIKQNVETAARRPRISSGSWMRFNHSYVTSIGRTLSSVSTSSSA